MADGGGGAGAASGLGLVGGIIGAGAGLVTSIFGNEAAKQAALEKARRAALSGAQQLGGAEARAGTSGFSSTSGSMAGYLASMGSEFQRQNDWAVKQAYDAANLGNIGSIISAAQGFGSSFASFGKSQNWWQGSPEATT